MWVTHRPLRVPRPKIGIFLKIPDKIFYSGPLSMSPEGGGLGRPEQLNRLDQLAGVCPFFRRLPLRWSSRFVTCYDIPPVFCLFAFRFLDFIKSYFRLN